MPNGSDKLNNFVARVWDETAQAYRPIYVAPDATDTVQGDVKLSDSIESDLDAANGMTAATPKAVKAAVDSANVRLHKEQMEPQTVLGPVSFNSNVTLTGGATGDLNGNALTATTLKTTRAISVKVGQGVAGTADFNGSSDITIDIPSIDASKVTVGTLPIAVVPHAALERLVKVANEAARFALTTDDIQLGDTVLQLDTEIMYVVVDTNNLSNASGYQEYQAGTAVSAEVADKVQHSLTVQKNGVLQFTYDGSAAQTLNVATDFTDLSGQIALGQIPDSLITDAKINFNYAGSQSKGGPANSALKFTTGRNISLTGPITGTVLLDGTQDVSIATTITNEAVTNANLATNAVSTVKIQDSAITTEKINSAAVTTDKINNQAVGLVKLGTDVGTIIMQDEEPQDATGRILLWIKP